MTAGDHGMPGPSEPPPDYEPGKILDEHERFALRGLLTMNGASAIASLAFAETTGDYV